MNYTSPYHIDPYTDTINTNIDSYDINEYLAYHFVKEYSRSFRGYDFVGVVTSNYEVPTEDGSNYYGTIHHAIIQNKRTKIYCIATVVGLQTCTAKPVALGIIEQLLKKEQQTNQVA